MSHFKSKCFSSSMEPRSVVKWCKGLVKQPVSMSNNMTLRSNRYIKRNIILKKDGSVVKW